MGYTLRGDSSHSCGHNYSKLYVQLCGKLAYKVATKIILKYRKLVLKNQGALT